VHPSVFWDAEATFGTESLSVFKGAVVGAEAPTGSLSGVRKLASHPTPSVPKCRRSAVSVVTRTPKHEPSARHATRKLMAPPLRFLVLPAFLSLGNRCNGLPHRYDPLSRFLTFSAVFSRPNLATLFHVASAQRIPSLQSFPHSASRDTSRCPMLFCRFLLLRFGKVTLSVPLPQPWAVCRQVFYHRPNKTTSNWRGSSTLELCSN
jgi:hypothetical protein